MFLKIWNYRLVGFVDVGMVAIVLVAVVIRGFFVDYSHIPSSSMSPTLEVHDRVLVDKNQYSYRVPFTDDMQLTDVTPPEIGDVVTFSYGEIGGDVAIKRVIALGGDTVRIDGMDTYVNGKQIPSVISYGECGESGCGTDYQSVVHLETYGGKSYLVRYMLSVKEGAVRLRSGEWVVPEGHMFVLGDNRDRSYDTRFTEVSGIPYESIHGKAERVFAHIDLLGLNVNLGGDKL